VTAEDRKAVEVLQDRFHDMEIWMKASEANGKMIPSLGNIASICRDMSKLCSILKKVT
jgi:hypothetical protein